MVQPPLEVAPAEVENDNLNQADPALDAQVEQPEVAQQLLEAVGEEIQADPANPSLVQAQEHEQHEVLPVEITPAQSENNSNAGEDNPTPYSTPEPEHTRVYDNPLIEEEEEDMPPIPPDPPIFHGEGDNIPAYQHALLQWGEKISLLKLDKQSVSGLLTSSFPFQLLALAWYKGRREEILTQVTTVGQGEIQELCAALSAAKQKDFEHLLDDKDAELRAMVYKKGDNLASFASRFMELVKETGENKETAFKLFRSAIHENAPDLAAQIRSKMLEPGATALTLEQGIAYAQRLSNLQAQEKKMGTTKVASSSTRKHAVAVSEESATEKVKYVDRPCPLPGHDGHYMHDCRLYKKNIADLQAQTKVRSAKGQAGMRTAMHTTPHPQDTPKQADGMDGVMAQMAAMTASVGELAKVVGQQMAQPQPPRFAPTDPMRGGYDNGRYGPSNAMPNMSHSYTAQSPQDYRRDQQRGPSRSYASGSQHPQCSGCGRNHPPEAACFGRHYERAPGSQPVSRMHAAPMRALPAPAPPPSANFASNSDLHFPESFATMTMPGYVAVQAGHDPIAAATPVSFTRRSGKEVLGSKPARESQPSPTSEASVIEKEDNKLIELPLHSLSMDQLCKLQENKACKIRMLMPASTASALLQCTPLLPPAAAVAAPRSALCARREDGTPVSFEEYDREEATVYRVEEGISFGYDGRTFTAKNALFDTGSSANLISKETADMYGIEYELHGGTSVSQSGGGIATTVGKVKGPFSVILKEGTAHEARTQNLRATTFSVMEGVHHLYSIMISSHVAKDLGAMADPVTNKLMYYPFMRQNDWQTKDSIPLITTTSSAGGGKSLICCVTQTSPQGVFLDEAEGEQVSYASDGSGTSTASASDSPHTSKRRQKLRKKERKRRNKQNMRNQPPLVLKNSAQADTSVSRLPKRKGQQGQELCKVLRWPQRGINGSTATCKVSHLGLGGMLLLSVLMANVQLFSFTKPEPQPARYAGTRTLCDAQLYWRHRDGR